MKHLSKIALLALTMHSALASDLQREQDYATQLQNSLAAHQIVWLKAGDDNFLALFKEAEKTKNQQAAILLHDMGDQPDQQPIIQPLRHDLPLHNWSSLSLQMPLREAGASPEDYYTLFDQASQRITAATRYLQDKGAKQIAIVGYGMGAAMACYHAQNKPYKSMALALISLPLPQSSITQAKIGDFLKSINLPILDLYAEFDLPEVINSAEQRRMLTKDNPVYRQLRIDGENHAYLADPALVVKRIHSWLALIAAEK